MLDRQEELSALFALGVPMLRLHYFDEITGMCSCKKDCGKNIAKHPKEFTKKGEVAWKLLKSAKTLTNCNIAIQCGPIVVVVDVDPRNGGNEALARLEAQHGPLPMTWRVATGGGGWHYYFKSPRPDYPCHAIVPRAVDVKGSGGYVVGPCSIHASGREYGWDISPHVCGLAPLPEWIVAMEASRSEVAKQSHLGTEECLYSDDEIIDAIMSIPIESANRDTWTRIGMALQAHGFDSDVWDRWSAQSPVYRGRESLEKIWKSFGKNGKGGITIGSVIRMAQENGWEPKKSERWELNPQKECEPTVIPPELNSGDDEDSLVAITKEPVKGNFEPVISHNEEPIASDTRKEINFPPGLAGDMAKLYYNHATHSSVIGAIAAQDMTLAGIGQASYCTPILNGVTNSYAVLVGESGAGKDFYLGIVGEVMRQVTNYGPMGTAQSAQALYRKLSENRAQIIEQDEVMISLKKMCSGNLIDDQMKQTLLSAWNKTARQWLPGLDNKKAEESSKEVKGPCLSYWGVGTPSGLRDLLVMKSDLMAGGFLSRFDVFMMEKNLIEKDFNDLSELILPMEIKRHLFALRRAGGCEAYFGMATHVDPSGREVIHQVIPPANPVKVAWATRETGKRWDDYRRENERRAKLEAADESGELVKTLLLRMAHKAVKRASRYAAFDGCLASVPPCIDDSQLDYAIDLGEYMFEDLKAAILCNVGSTAQGQAEQAILAGLRAGLKTWGKIRNGQWVLRSLDWNTCRASLESLEAQGLITVEAGRKCRGLGKAPSMTIKLL